jgi:acyl-coenzyme A synthetase/AMP-(fatty) acid ligase
MRLAQLNLLIPLFIVPKYVFFVQDYPKTPSGKIQKFKLRESGIKWLQEGKGL